jgi:hypothetical protein
MTAVLAALGAFLRPDDVELSRWQRFTDCPPAPVGRCRRRTDGGHRG